MGAAGAALAGSVGQGLQRRALAQQQLQGLGAANDSGRTFLTGEEIWSLLPPQAQGLYGEGRIPGQARVPVEGFDDLLSFLARFSTTGAPGAGSPTVRATPEMQAAGLPETLSLSDYELAAKLFPPPEAAPALGAPEGPRLQVTPPESVAGAFGLEPGQPVDVGALGDLALGAQRLSQAGFQVAPTEPEPEPELLPYPEQLVAVFPSLAGRQGTVEQVQAHTDLAFDLAELGVKQVDAERKARELAVWSAEMEGRFRSPDEVRSELRRMGLDPNTFYFPETLPVGDYAGQIDMNEFFARNESLGRIREAAANVGLVTTRIEGERLSNQLKRLEVEAFPERLQAELDREAAQTGLSLAQTRRIEALLPTEIATSQTELDRLRQDIENGRTMAGLQREKMQAEIDRLRSEGRISAAEADYLERTADVRAALLEVQLQREQQEISPLQLGTLWPLLGLPGEPPAGLEFRQYQFDDFIRAVEERPGTVIKGRDLFTAAGMDLSEIPQEVLDAYVEIDSAGQLAGTLRDLQSYTLQPITTKLGLVQAILDVYMQDTTQNLLTFMLAQSNPELARQMFAPAVERLPEDLGALVQRLFDDAIRETGYGNGFSFALPTPEMPPSVPTASSAGSNGTGAVEAASLEEMAQMLVERFGSASRAIRWVRENAAAQGWSQEDIDALIVALEGGGQ